MEGKRNNFLDGLLVGATVGGVAVFLLGTKKGREVLKVLQEEGREKFSRLEGIFSDYQELLGSEEEYLEDEFEEITKELPNKVEEVKHAAKATSDKTKNGLRKRLFKGLPRRKSS